MFVLRLAVTVLVLLVAAALMCGLLFILSIGGVVPLCRAHDLALGHMKKKVDPAKDEGGR